MKAKKLFLDLNRSLIEYSEMTALFLRCFPEEAQWEALANRKNFLNVNLEFDNSATWIEPVRLVPCAEKSKLERLKALASEAAARSRFIAVIASGAAWSSTQTGADFFEADNTLLFMGRTPDEAEKTALLSSADFSVCVIEDGALSPCSQMAYKNLKELLRQKYGAGFADRIYIFTNNTESSLCGEPSKACFAEETATGPELVLSEGPLFLLSAAGVNIDDILEGAELEPLPDTSLFVPNCCGDGGIGKESFFPYSYQNIKYYSIVRDILEAGGKTAEIFIWQDKRFDGMSQWLTDLLLESESSLYPTTLSLDHIGSLTAHLKKHKGRFFETFLDFDDYRENPFEENETSHRFIVNQAMRQQYSCQIPILRIVVPEASPYLYGNLTSMFLRVNRLAGLWRLENAS